MLASNSTLAIALQPAGLRHARTITRLSKRCFGPDAWSILDVIAMLLLPSTVTFRVLDGPRLVGFAALRHRRRRNMAWITTLCVDADYRQQGIGSQLLQACEAASAPLPRIRLTVQVGNQPALALYRKFGYDTLWRIPRYYSSGADGFEMEKWIAAAPKPG